jgi:hypothetical protein
MLIWPPSVVMVVLFLLLRYVTPKGPGTLRQATVRWMMPAGRLLSVRDPVVLATRFRTGTSITLARGRGTEGVATTTLS